MEKPLNTSARWLQKSSDYVTSNTRHTLSYIREQYQRMLPHLTTIGRRVVHGSSALTMAYGAYWMWNNIEDMANLEIPLFDKEAGLDGLSTALMPYVSTVSNTAICVLSACLSKNSVLPTTFALLSMHYAKADEDCVLSPISDQTAIQGVPFDLFLNTSEIFRDPLDTLIIREKDNTTLPDWLRLVNVSIISPKTFANVACVMGIAYPPPFYQMQFIPGGLQVIDVSNPNDLTLMGNYTTLTADVRGVEVVGETAYIANYVAGLQLLDLTNLDFFPLLGGYKVAGVGAMSVKVVGTTAYVASSGQSGSASLQIIDVSNPNNPTLMGSYSATGGDAYDLTVIGTTAYVSGHTGLQIIDVSDSSHPAPLGSYAISDNAWHIKVRDAIAYVAAGTAGLRIINVSDLTSPTLLASYAPLGFYAFDVVVSGTSAYIAASQGLYIVDVSDPVHPLLLGNYPTPDYAQGVAIIDSTAYVAANDAGLIIIDVSNVVSPRLLGSWVTLSPAFEVTITEVKKGFTFTLQGVPRVLRHIQPKLAMKTCNTF